MKKGYFIRAFGHDCFLETDSKKRTKTLAIDFLNKIQNAINRFYNINEDTIKFVQNAMQPAYCEIKTTSKGRQYYNIFGDDFGGYGTFIDDNETLILN